MTEVLTGMMHSLAVAASKKIGAKIQVFRDGKKYTLTVEGCHPPVFLNLTPIEVKGRLAMLYDMAASGVIGPAVVKGELEQQSGDIALAISEHAFRAGWSRAEHYCATVHPEALPGLKEKSWGEYTPPEEFCGFNFTVKEKS